MPAVVIELTISALQGVCEGTAKYWDGFSKLYSFTLPLDEERHFKV